jgi:hypothetical protein
MHGAWLVTSYGIIDPLQHIYTPRTLSASAFSVVEKHLHAVCVVETKCICSYSLVGMRGNGNVSSVSQLPSFKKKKDQKVPTWVMQMRLKKLRSPGASDSAGSRNTES